MTKLCITCLQIFTIYVVIVPLDKLLPKCFYTKDEEDVKRELVNLFTTYIPGHWQQLKTELRPDIILRDLLKRKLINKEEHKKYKEQEATNSNLFILQKMTTEYMEMNSGKVKGLVFKNILKKQPKNVKEILSQEVVVRRWSKRGTVRCILYPNSVKL